MALPAERDQAGQPIWRGGASLSPELSLPKLQARWDAGATPPRRTTRLSVDERVQVWGEARQAVDDATTALRRRGGDDPAAAADVARSAADVLNVTARVGEPTGKGPLHDAARAYDRASREAYGRAGRTSAAGTDLRLATTTLALVTRAGRDDGAGLVALTVALAGLLDAVAELRAAQARSAQAAAARAAAEQLRGVGASWAAGGVVGATRVAAATSARPQEPPPGPRRARGR